MFLCSYLLKKNRERWRGKKIRLGDFVVRFKEKKNFPSGGLLTIGPETYR
jgi:hypothetical protein